MIRLLRCVTFICLAGAVGVGVMTFGKARQSPTDFDEPMPLGAFAFTSSNGGTLTDGDVRGHVCIFACFFTCCTDTCPQITGAMARLQDELKGVKGLRLISLTVDPERDTPDKLKAYGATFGANPERWVFLSGQRPQVESFVMRQLKQGLQEQPDAEPGLRFIHSDKLTLVDRAGNIRGWFSGTDPEAIQQLIRAVKQLP